MRYLMFTPAGGNTGTEIRLYEDTEMAKCSAPTMSRSTSTATSPPIAGIWVDMERAAAKRTSRSRWRWSSKTRRRGPGAIRGLFRSSVGQDLDLIQHFSGCVRSDCQAIAGALLLLFGSERPAATVDFEIAAISRESGNIGKVIPCNLEYLSPRCDAERHIIASTFGPIREERSSNDDGFET